MHSSRLRTARSLPYRGVSVKRGWAGLSGGVLSQVDRPPRGQTDACENITLPQTSFAGGDK